MWLIIFFTSFFVFLFILEEVDTSFIFSLIILLISICLAWPPEEKIYYEVPIELQEIKGKKILDMESRYLIKYNDSIRIIPKSDLKIQYSDSTYDVVKYTKVIRDFTKNRSRFIPLIPPHIREKEYIIGYTRYKKL
jgi:hypothetical protein